MRKKYKIEQAILKMYGDSPEGKALGEEIHMRQWRRERLKDRAFEAFNYIGFFLVAVIGISLVVAVIICPATYYTDSYTKIKMGNISESDYAYILAGNDDMRLSYRSERRNLDDSDIVFRFAVSHTWNSDIVVHDFLAAGNISSKIIEK